MALMKEMPPGELLSASDEEIRDAVSHADPMVLRGLLYQLTGDAELKTVGVQMVMVGFAEVSAPATDADLALLQRKAAEFLIAYRDGTIDPVGAGPRERLGESLSLVAGVVLDENAVGAYSDELGLDPYARSLKWQAEPDPEKLKNFNVLIIGAGMGGLIAALELRRAGIPYTIIEKNSGVGGTWYENRYPGARVDTPSRGYSHMVGVDYPHPNSFCGWKENLGYFNWVADHFDLRKDVTFETEAKSLTWDDSREEWSIVVEHHGEERTIRSKAVITAVGFLSRPNLPELEGAAAFKGQSWHTARWPEDTDMSGKRVAVIGTGCTGYQMVPELALTAEHVSVFQRTPQWFFPVPGYRDPLPPQALWLDRNMPLYTNFVRFRNLYTDRVQAVFRIDPDFDHPHAISPANNEAREQSLAFLNSKLSDPDLVANMTPKHPVWSARAVIVDPEYCFLDALHRDNVELVTTGIRRITENGIEAADGRHHEVDVIVYATGFHATEYLYPMKITGRNGIKLEDVWSEGGARAYRGCMVPGFPNMWSLYGPNTSGGLSAASFHEMVTHFAMRCLERLILEDKDAIEAREEPYRRYNQLIDEKNARLVWSDPRANNYYWTKHGRSAVMNPFVAGEMWHFLRHPDFDELQIA